MSLKIALLFEGTEDKVMLHTTAFEYIMALFYFIS